MVQRRTGFIQRLVARFSLILVAVAAVPAGVMAQNGGDELYGAPSGVNMQKGIELMMKGNYRYAVPYFEAAYKAGEHPPFACWHQAICYYNMGDRARAKQFLGFLMRNFPKSRMIASSRNILTRMNQPDPPAKIELPADYAQTYKTAGLPQRSFGGAASMTARTVDQNSEGGVARYGLTRGGHMIVTANINGQPIKAMFDTGAEVTMFSTSQLEAAGIKLDTKRSNMVIHGVAGQTNAQEAQVTLDVGGVSKKVKIYVTDDSAQRNNQGADSVLSYGLLGEDFFGSFMYTINDSDRTITFHPSGAFHSKNPDAVPFFREGALMIVKPKVNGRECEMIFDTGCSGVAFTDKQIGGMGLSRPTSAGQGRASGVGGSRDAYMFELDSMKLGPVERKNVQASCDIYGTSDRPLLGSSFLRGLTITIDPREKLIHFSAP